MIKNFSSILIFSILLLSCIEDDSRLQSHEKLKIKQVLMSQQTAWNEGNISKFMQGYLKSDSLQFISGRGRTFGWKHVLEAYQRHYPTVKEMGKLEFTNLDIKLLTKDLVQVFGHWKLIKETNAEGSFSLIMKKVGSSWKIMIDHTW